MGYGWTCRDACSVETARVFENSCKFLRRNLLSDNYGNGITVAEDHELPGVFHSAKSTSAHFKAKALAPNQAFYILNRSAQYSTFGGGAGTEQLNDPAIWRNGCRQILHGTPPASSVADTSLTRR
jgi:hypothetical protein